MYSINDHDRRRRKSESIAVDMGVLRHNPTSLLSRAGRGLCVRALQLQADGLGTQRKVSSQTQVATVRRVVGRVGVLVDQRGIVEVVLKVQVAGEHEELDQQDPGPFAKSLARERAEEKEGGGGGDK